MKRKALFKFSKSLNPRKTGALRQIHRGFTLVEVMVVVAIIAVLASFALPAYNDHVMRGKLSEAHTILGQLRVKAEQHFQDNRTYVGMACAPSGSDAKYFTYSCSSAATATTYTLSAAGVAAHGTAGMTYTLDQANTKATAIASPSTWTAGTYACWVTKRTSC